MKKQSFWGLTLLVPLMISACAAEPKKKDKMPDPGETFNPIPALSGPRGAKPSNTAGEFYVSLYNNPQWIPDSTKECLDPSALAWLRKVFRKDSEEISVVIILKTNDGDQSKEQQIPLFVLGKDEDAESKGTPECYSAVIKGQLSPWYRADSNTKFNIQFEIGTKEKSDFSGAEKVLKAADKLMEFSGTSNFIVKKMTSEQFKEVGAAVDASIEQHLSVGTHDKIAYELVPLGDEKGAIQFSTPGIAATAGGVNKTVAKTPAFTIGMIYTSSVFAGPDGKYPSDYNQILTRSLAPQYGFTPSSLKSLIEHGIGGVTRNNLGQITSEKSANSICRELKLQLSTGFSAIDALVSRFSVLRQFSPSVLKNSDIASEECLTQAERNKLEALGFEVPELLRNEASIRDTEVVKLMDPIVKAMRRNDVDGLRQRMTADTSKVGLVVLPRLKVLPTYSPSDTSWNAEGELAISKLATFGKGARIGCYKAPLHGPLTQIGAIATYGQETIGTLFQFSNDGRLEQVILAPTDDVRRMGGLGDNFPSPTCALL